MESHQLVNQSSGNTEIYTPPEIVDAWHDVLGEIDLDPASSETANRSIRAKAIFTEPAYTVTQQEGQLSTRHYESWGGLGHRWPGKCCLNPPFGNAESACKPHCKKKGCVKRGWHTDTDLPGMSDWVKHFTGEHLIGRMTEGMFLCFAATSEGWFQPLLRYPQCFFRGRTNYMLPDGTRYQGATKGSVCTYLGPNVERFAEVFRKLGTVKVDYHS